MIKLIWKLFTNAKDLSRKEHDWLLSQTQQVFRKAGYNRRELVQVVRRTLEQRQATGKAERASEGKADGTNPSG